MGAEAAICVDDQGVAGRRTAAGAAACAWAGRAHDGGAARNPAAYRDGGQSAVELARSLLERSGGLRELDRKGAEELQEAKGLGLAKIAQLKAAWSWAVG